MLYLIDTADREKIRHCCEFFPIDGVTTNPTIISKEKTDFGTLIKDIRNIIGADRMLHIQVTSSTAEGMVKEAAALKDFVGGNLYIKVPICAEGLKATREIREDGTRRYRDRYLHTAAGAYGCKGRRRLRCPLCQSPR